MRLPRNDEPIGALPKMLLLREAQIWVEGELEGGQEAAGREFINYVETIYAAFQSDEDFPTKSPREARKKICGLALIAWNTMTDSDSLAEALARTNKMPLPIPKEHLAEAKKLLTVLVKMKWEMFPEYLTYIEDIEFTAMPNELHDVAMTLLLAWVCARTADAESMGKLMLLSTRQNWWIEEIFVP